MFSFNSIHEELNVDIDVSPIDNFLYKYQTNQTDGFRRSQILDGVYYRENTSSTKIDISVNNYPNSTNEFDTNTGLSWIQNKGIANITLSGESIQSVMPLVSNNDKTSFVDIINILKFYFGLDELKMNLTGNNEKLLLDTLSNNLSNNPVSVVEKNFTKNILTPTSDDDNNDIYISFNNSSPTKWCRVKFISVELDNIDFCDNQVTGIIIKLVLDGMYIPRLCIKTEPNVNDSLLIWNEKPTPQNYLSDVEKYSSCQYLKKLRKQETPNLLSKIIKSDNPHKIGLSSKSFSYINDPLKIVKDYIYFSYTNEMYKIVKKDFKDNILWIETYIPIPFTKPNDTIVVSFVDKKYVDLYNTEIFMVDYIRDRFANFLFIAALSDINKNKFTESFLGLVKRLSGVHIFNDLLYYYNLIEFYNVKKSHNSTEYMNKIFNFICDNMYFYTQDKNIEIAGTVLSDIYSTNSRMNLVNYERLSGINTELNIEYPEDWCHMNKITESGKTISLNTIRKIGIKKILFQDCSVFKNKNYCTLIKYAE
jgi:hypothetical protein